jgi:hypothetical protein
LHCYTSLPLLLALLQQLIGPQGLAILPFLLAWQELLLLLLGG